MKNEKEIRYFSMFTGVGGFELGIERANNDKFNTSPQNNNERVKSNTSSSNGRGRRTYTYDCVGFSETDKYASELLNNKFPTIKNYGDATRIIPEELPDFELLVGGFPCQAFSIAGKRKGFEDTRGTLFYDIARILKVKRPKHILLENVKGLLSHDRGRTFATILNTLSELGYVVQWMVLNSKFFGVPQNRERVFIVGSLAGEPIPEILPLGEEHGKDDTKIRRLGHMKGFRRYNQTYDISGQIESLDVSGGGGHQPCVVQRTPLKYMNRNQKHIEGDYSFTIDSANTGGIKQGMKIRRLTPIECERLQGFPDNWTEGFSDTQRYKMMGNAVTVNVISAIMGRMMR